MRLWKVTGPKGEACHGGSFTYDLPKWSKARGWVPGAWTPEIPNPVACWRGYHLCRDQDLVTWCNGARIWAAEAEGVIELSDKVVARRVRLLAPTPWDDVTARLFAVDVAAQVRHLNADPRVEEALEVAHRFALGDATDDECRAASAAANAAANAAADAAARAARAAARAADAAAWAAADAAAWAAADAAARAAAWAAGARQTKVLLWWIGAESEYPE